MIPFEEIDAKLAALNKSRAWLAEVTGRSPGSIGSALAPNASTKHRSELLQKALSDAIEREELKANWDDALDRVSLDASPEEIRAWNLAALQEGKLTADWAVEALNEAAERAATVVPQAYPPDNLRANGTDGM